MKFKNADDIVRKDAINVIESNSCDLRSLEGGHIYMTGGTGILGKWILELISVLNDRHNLDICVTVLSRNPNAFILAYKHFIHTSWLNLIQGDVRHLCELPRDVSHIIHAAALTDRRIFASQPSLVADVNLCGTQRIIHASSLLEEIPKFILLSSGLVYGHQPIDKDRIDEDFAGPLHSNNVNSVYAESKRFSETLTACASSEYKLPAVILRPFAFVGPYQSLNLPWAITDFIRDSLSGGPVRIMGDGTTVRSIMYAADFAYWVLAAAALAKPKSTYNIGSPHPLNLLTLAEHIIESFDPQPKILINLGGHKSTRLVPDVSRAMKDLGLKITIPAREAIMRTIEWHRLSKIR